MKVQKVRSRAFDAQQGLCFYCNLPMAASPEELQSFARTHGLKAREAHALLATAEHLHARRDGGGDSPENIAAAHHVCNMRRHRTPSPMSPEHYRSKVQRRCRNGKWHSPKVLRLMPLHQRPG